MQSQLKIFDTLIHSEICQVAAVYAYHIIKNHPFIDGNKRTGMVAALTFLYLNHYEINVSQDDIYYFAMGIASSQITKDEVIIYFKEHIVKY
jgi:death-on-curing protein